MITLTNDEDLRVALSTQSSLYIHVFSNSEELRSEIAKLNNEFNKLKNTMDRLSLLIEESVVQYGASQSGGTATVSSSLTSTVKPTESIATIHPTVHEEVSSI